MLLSCLLPPRKGKGAPLFLENMPPPVYPAGTPSASPHLEANAYIMADDEPCWCPSLEGTGGGREVLRG